MSEAPEGRFYRALGENIRDRREALHMSQATLATRLGLSRVSITNIEAGRQRPLAHHVAVLADQLETSVEDLMPKFDVPEYDAEQALDAEMLRLVRTAASAQQAQ